MNPSQKPATRTSVLISSVIPFPTEGRERRHARVNDSLLDAAEQLSVRAIEELLREGLIRLVERGLATVEDMRLLVELDIELGVERYIKRAA